MEGNGPGSGDPRRVGLLIGGTNPVAVDVIAAEVVGIPRRLLHVERMAEKLKIEGSRREMIRTIGAEIEDVMVKDFRLPHISDVQFGLPSFFKKHLKQYITSRPLAVSGKCRLCGICVDACPPKAMAIRNGRLTIDYHSCIRCFCCRELCPDGALDVVDGILMKYLRKFD
jgi:ferredoxin